MWTHLHLASIEELGWVRDEPARPITLHTCDNVVGLALNTLRDDAEAVILHDAGAADTAEETLLDTLAELDDSNTRRGLHRKKEQTVRRSGAQGAISTHGGDLNRDSADGSPRDADPTRSLALFDMHAQQETLTGAR